MSQDDRASSRSRLVALIALGAVLGVGCGGGKTDSSTSQERELPASTLSEPMPSTAQAVSVEQTTTSSIAAAVTTTAGPPPTATSSTSIVSVSPSMTTTTSTTTIATTTTTLPPASTTPYVVPIADAAAAGWGTTHSGYPATDIFRGCGASIVSPVNGSVLEVRRVDGWDPSVDNPATRGGRSVSLLGDDGVRYYVAHFETIDESVIVGSRTSAGQFLGTMGTSGRSSACHTHFSISPPCPGKEWSVRRGAIWPYPYLDAWRAGSQRSPVDEIQGWLAANPDACALAMLDPFAGDA